MSAPRALANGTTEKTRAATAALNITTSSSDPAAPERKAAVKDNEAFQKMLNGRLIGASV
jgi:hypothetical protein